MVEIADRLARGTEGAFVRRDARVEEVANVESEAEAGSARDVESSASGVEHARGDADAAGEIGRDAGEHVDAPTHAYGTDRVDDIADDVVRGTTWERGAIARARGVVALREVGGRKAMYMIDQHKLHHYLQLQLVTYLQLHY